jgi:hypothetical protein
MTGSSASSCRVKPGLQGLSGLLVLDSRTSEREKGGGKRSKSCFLKHVIICQRYAGRVYVAVKGETKVRPLADQVYGLSGTMHQSKSCARVVKILRLGPFETKPYTV